MILAIDRYETTITDPAEHPSEVLDRLRAEYGDGYPDCQVEGYAPCGPWEPVCTWVQQYEPTSAYDVRAARSAGIGAPIEGTLSAIRVRLLWKRPLHRAEVTP